MIDMKRMNEKFEEIMKPEYTLHKLPVGFIVTSDEEAKGEDFQLRLDTLKISKIIDIENPKDGFIRKKVIAQQDQIDFSNLSEEEQKEIGWFDVEKLGEDATNLRILRHKTPNQIARQYYEGYLEGFQKAQELLSDRMSTLEDMFNCFRAGMEYEKEGGILQPYTQGYIYSLLHSKSWLVEIETESVHTDHVEGGFEYFPKFTNGKIKILKLL